MDAARLLEEAVRLDPNFFLGYCTLASVHDQIYFGAIDHTPARLALARGAVDIALRLRPESGESHLALAEHLYCGYADYDRARAELQIARQSLPNEPRVFELTSYIDRRQGRWDKSLLHLKRALELDPRNLYYMQQLARSYGYLRRYSEEDAILARALEIAPHDTGMQIQRAAIALEAHADTKPLRAIIDALVRENPASASGFAEQWFYLALCEHDFEAASRALAAIPEKGATNEGFAFPKAWFEGFFGRVSGDTTLTETALSHARITVAKTMDPQSDYAQPLCILGMIDAALGRKSEAIREGREASSLLPVSKESINGSLLMQYLALIYTWCGETDAALSQLEATARIPSPVTYGDLRLNPAWDSLRKDPRFDKIVASLAPGASTP
jgi:tetratricopeptide (TPR) repeat protein